MLNKYTQTTTDTKLQALPPLKRHRFLQHQENKENEPISLQLPAKKRKESRNPLLANLEVTVTAPATYCLPSKKRVWALDPDLLSSKSISPFDLNVEFNPFHDEIRTSEEYKKSPLAIGTSSSFESEQDDLKEKKKVMHLDEISQEVFKEEGDKGEEVEDKEEDDGIFCAICRSTDGDLTDPIVFCDGCDLMVHTTCYGNPLIKGVPDGDWFCTVCLNSQSDKASKQSSLSCCLCPTKGGALKPTTTEVGHGSWAHVVCALLIPEVFFEDPVGRDGIDCSKVPKRRWEGKCYICKSRKGCVIECSEPKCPLSFHITCGLDEDLCIEYKDCKKKETIVAGFCKSHTELWDKQQQTGKFKIVAREEHRK